MERRGGRIFAKTPHMTQCFEKMLEESEGKAIALTYDFK